MSEHSAIAPARRRPDEPDGELHDAFSAARSRRHAARVYVLTLKPALIVVAVVLTVISWLIDPALIPTQLWWGIVAFVAVQALWIALVLRGFDPVAVAGTSLMVDAALEYVTLFFSPEPAGSSATLTFFIVAAAYFLSTTLTLAFTVACTVSIIVAAQVIDAWGESYALPSTAFVALLTGILSAFIMSRVRRTERQLERVASTQREALERIRQVASSRDRLVANVSHELRTPLTSTIGAIDTVLRDDIDLGQEQARRLLHIARDGGLRLLALVEDLLTIGSTRPESLQLSATPERLVTLAHDAVAGIGEPPGRSIQLESRADPIVLVDRLRMLQVVTNLIVNAIRHGAGTVTVDVDASGEHAVLRVLDEGSGVPPANAEELFLPFAKFSSRPDSTGLGLAICRTLVDAHGGSIRYARTPEDQTAFIVELPIDEPTSP